MKNRHFSLVGLVALGIGAAASATEVKRPATVIVVSPHHGFVRQEIGDAFVKHVKDAGGGDVTVVWIDQGGTIGNLRYIKQRVAEAKRSKAAGTGIDIVWGGGSEAFSTLKDAKILVQIVAPKGLFTQQMLTAGSTAFIDGTYDPAGYWLGAAVSTFGVIYDEARLKALTGTGPALLDTWESLADVRLSGRLIVGDPRTSAISAYILPSLPRLMGWEKAWSTWAGLYGNSNAVGRRTSDTLKALQTRQADVGLIIDYLAQVTASAQGGGTLRYKMPVPLQDADVDPIGKVVGGPNGDLADKFIRFVVSEAGQRLISQPVGTPGGPKANAIGRVPVLKSLQPSGSAGKNRDYLSVQAPFVAKKPEGSARLPAQPFLRDLIGETFVDHVTEVRQVWNACIKANKVTRTSSPFAPPLTAAELQPLEKQWQDIRTRPEALAVVRARFLASLEAAKLSCSR